VCGSHFCSFASLLCIAAPLLLFILHPRYPISLHQPTHLTPFLIFYLLFSAHTSSPTHSSTTRGCLSTPSVPSTMRALIFSRGKPSSLLQIERAADRSSFFLISLSPLFLVANRHHNHYAARNLPFFLFVPFSQYSLFTPFVSVGSYPAQPRRYLSHFHKPLTRLVINLLTSLASTQTQRKGRKWGCHAIQLLCNGDPAHTLVFLLSPLFLKPLTIPSDFYAHSVLHTTHAARRTNAAHREKKRKISIDTLNNSLPLARIK
jgi:hypothetical protein